MPSIVGAIFFCTSRKQVLHVVRPKWRGKTITDSCINGSSEMVSVLAFSVITILFNRILMSLGGSDGVASLSIIWYAQGLFGGLFRGYVNGISSVVSYNLGRGDKARLSKLFRISVFTLLGTSAVVTAVSYLLGGAVVGFFAKGNAHDGVQCVCIRLVHGAQRREDLRHSVVLPHDRLHGPSGAGAAAHI